MTILDLSTVSLSITEKDQALKVQLHNHRTRAIAQTIQALGPDKAREILRALLGLCPVAQVYAFEAAQKASQSQGTQNPILINECSQKLVTAEAMLETLRVLSMDMQPYIIHGKVSPESLKTIGELRSKLWALTTNEKPDSVAIEDFLQELKTFIIMWFTREKTVIGAIKHTFERFDDIEIDGKALLFPEEITNREILRLFVKILEEFPEWALSPQLAGARIPGALARSRSVKSQGRRDPFTIRDIVLSRIDELKNYASDLTTALSVQAFYLGDGWGAGIAETARGTLIHFLNYENNKVRFHIVAPTEWTFQEESPIVEVMNTFANKKIHAVKSIITGLNLIGCAFDPCTRFELHWPQKEI